MKGTWVALTWIRAVGGAIGISTGIALAAILEALEVAGGGAMAGFAGASFALGFWTLAWAVTDRD